MRFTIEDPDETTIGKYNIKINDQGETLVDALIHEDVVETAADAYTEAVTDPDVLRTLANLIETGDPVESPGL